MKEGISPHVLYAGPPVGPRISDQPDTRALSATLEEMAPHLTVHDQRNVASGIRLYHAHLFGNLTKPPPKRQWLVRAEMDFKTFKVFDTFMDAAREIDLLAAAGHLVIVQYGERTP